MKIKNQNFFDWLKPRNWGFVKVYRDLENFADWKKTILKEQANPKSKYNQWKLERTKLFDIYTVISLEEADANLTENIQRTKVVELLNPLHRYLDDELGFAECLNIEFNQFQDDQGKPTLSYLVVYHFNFNKLSLKWVIKSLIKLAILIFFIIRFDLIISLFSWISNSI